MQLRDWGGWESWKKVKKGTSTNQIVEALYCEVNPCMKELYFETAWLLHPVTVQLQKTKQTIFFIFYFLEQQFSVTYAPVSEKGHFCVWNELCFSAPWNNSSPMFTKGFMRGLGYLTVCKVAFLKKYMKGVLEKDCNFVSEKGSGVVLGLWHSLACFVPKSPSTFL